MSTMRNESEKFPILTVFAGDEWDATKNYVDFEYQADCLDTVEIALMVNNSTWQHLWVDVEVDDLPEIIKFLQEIVDAKQKGTEQSEQPQPQA